MATTQVTLSHPYNGSLPGAVITIDAAIARGLVGDGYAVYTTPPVSPAPVADLLTRVGVLESVMPNDTISQAPLGVIGNSYGAINRTIAKQRYPERLARRIRGSFGNSCVSGMLVHDIASFIYGSFTKATGGSPSTPVVGTQNPSPATYGAFIVEGVRNDAGWDGGTASGNTTTKARAGFVAGLKAIIALLQASIWKQDTDASFVYAGTWTTQTGNVYYKGGTVHNTTVPGSTCTITTPVLPTGGGDVDVVLQAWDSGFGVSGAAYTVTVDGVAQPALTGTTNDAVACSVSQSTIGSQVTIPVHGLTAGAHTIVVTHAGSGSTQNLTINGLLVRSPNPVQVVIPKAARLGTAGYAAYTGAGASWATDQIYNGLIDTVCALYADGSVSTFDPNAAGWDPTTGISSADPQSLHPGDFGSDLYADGLMAHLNGLAPRIGLLPA